MPKLSTEIRAPEMCFGLEDYAVSVVVTNLLETPLDEVQVVPQLMPGIRREPAQQPKDVELKELDVEKRQIAREMEKQIQVAYNRKTLSEISWWRRLFLITSAYMVRILRSLLSSVSLGTISIERMGEATLASSVDLITDELSISLLPSWATQATRIENWEDVERLEEAVITAFEKDDSFLRLAFRSNKEKLRTVLDRLEESESGGNEKDLRDVYSIQPGEQMDFLFRGRVPCVFRVRDYELHFQISYRNHESGTIGTQPASQKIRFHPSAVVIFLGSLVGAVAGFVVRNSLITMQDWFTRLFWIGLAGSIGLALIVTMATAKTASSKRAITAEDFLGGFILGALAGMFAENMIQRLMDIVPGL